MPSTTYHLLRHGTSARTARRLTLASIALTASAALALPAVAAPSTDEGPQPRGTAVVPAPTEVDTDAATLRLEKIGTYETGDFDESAAEIVQYDKGTQRLFTVNAKSGAIDVLDASDPTNPTLIETLSMAGQQLSDGSTVPEGAEVNSVSVHDGVLAVATQAPDKVSHGWVLFFTADGDALGGVEVGSLPDMVTFSPDGSQAIVANEGEPHDDFTSDPEGSVSVIDTSDVRNVTQDDVRTARFTAWDEGRDLPEGVRVFGPDVDVPEGHEPAGRVARNLEPEYVAVSQDGPTAWVSLQEANAIAEVDLESAEVTDIRPVPTTDHSQDGFGLDASNKDDQVNITNWPVTGLPMPDSIASYTAGGSEYLVTANEGDAREWGDYNEELRVEDDEYELCDSAFSADEIAELKQEENLGRLKVTTGSGQTDEGCYDEIFSFGSRSFSILDAEGNRVFDSGETIEAEIARLIEDGVLPEHAFNANHVENPSFDNRSDDKGPEPEGLTIGEVDGRTYLFLGLERVGGVMVFDITDPADADYVTYLNTRNWDAEYEEEQVDDMGDLGPEGLEFVPAADSPTGKPMLAVGFEVSGTTSFFSVDSIAPERLGGENRYETAAQISSELDPGVKRVYLASGTNFPDALAGAALAGSQDTAVLLTKQGLLPGVTKAELQRLQPEEVVVLGGENAVSASVETSVEAIAPVRRLAGAHRYETAAEVAGELAGSDVVYVASGEDYPDALVASARAGAEDAPVVLTKASLLPGATREALEDAAPGKIVLLGGEDAVSESVESQLEGIAPVERIAGADRYETAAQLFADTGEVDVSFLASGQDYPDALVGSALAARTNAPLMLTRPDRLPGVTDEALRLQRPLRLVIFGGETAVSPQVSRDAAVRMR